MSNLQRRDDENLVSTANSSSLPAAQIPIPDLLTPPPPLRFGAVSEPHRLGTGELMSSARMAGRCQTNPGAFFLGETIDQAIGENGEPERVLLWDNSPAHVLVCAETRTGKSERLLINNLAHWPGSVFAVDTKGDLASQMAVRRGDGDVCHCDGLGQKVCVLDPERQADVDDKYRAHINPVDWLSADDPLCIAKARILAEGLIPDEDTAQGDPYWSQEGRELLAVFLVHLATGEGIPEELRTLSYARLLLMRGDLEDFQQLEQLSDFGDSPLDNSITPYSLMFTTMQQNPVFEDYVSAFATSLQDLFAEARKQYEGIASQARLALMWVAQPEMKQAMSRSDFSFDELRNREGGLSVFVSAKDMKSVNWRYVRLLVNMFTYDAKQSGETATGHKTLAILDEFNSLRKMNEMSELMDMAAGFSVRMVVVVQRLSQLKETYGENWVQFYSAASVRWFAGVEDPFTAEFLEKQCGDIGVELVSKSLGLSLSEQHSQTSTKGKSKSLSASHTETHSGTHATQHSEGINDSTTKGESRDKGTGHKQTIAGMIPGVNNIYDSALVAPGSKNKRKGKSKSETHGSNRTDSTSSSLTAGGSNTLSGTQGTSSSSSDTSSDGTSLNTTLSTHHHKRPLIPRDRFAYLTARVDNQEDPRHPGQVLVSFSGGERGFIRATPYHSHLIFYRSYGPHPVHPFRQAPIPRYVLAELEHKEWEIEAELERRFAPSRNLLEWRREQDERERIKKADLITVMEANQVWSRLEEHVLQSRGTLSFRIGFDNKTAQLLPSDDRIQADCEFPRTVRKGESLLSLLSGEAVLRPPLDLVIHEAHETHEYGVYQYTFTVSYAPSSVSEPLDALVHEIVGYSGYQHEPREWTLEEHLIPTPEERRLSSFRSLPPVDFSAVERSVSDEHCDFARSYHDYREAKFGMALRKNFSDLGDLLQGIEDELPYALPFAIIGVLLFFVGIPWFSSVIIFHPSSDTNDRVTFSLILVFWGGMLFGQPLVSHLTRGKSPLKERAGPIG